MQNTAYEMRISDWSSDVCSSDLLRPLQVGEDADVDAEFVRFAPNLLGAALLVLGSAVREVQAHDIDARGEHAAQHRGLVGRRAEGGNNLGAADHGIPGSPNTISVGARRAIGSVIETGFGGWVMTDFGTPLSAGAKRVLLIASGDLGKEVVIELQIGRAHV